MAIIKHAARQTLGQLIGANNPIVTVPDDSQRQYAWTKKEVDVFWSDIQKFRQAREKGLEASAEYFIGPIVTITEEQLTSRSLLDGQQRITTSTILISVIRDILFRMDTSESKAMANNVQRDYIARKAGRREPMEYFLALSLFDRDFFRDNIQDWSEVTGKTKGAERASRPSHHLIQAAYSNFESKITSELASIPDVEGRLDWLDYLHECLVKGLVFVEIQTPTSSDANEVFETINSRGKDLSTVDLVRNFLMEKSSGATEKERVNSAWRVLLDGFERREEIERFLRHYWVSRHGDVKSHSLYATIRTTLSSDFESPSRSYTVGMFAAEMESASNRYIELIQRSTGVSCIDAYLDEVATLSADALYPLLLAASEHHEYSALEDLIEAALSYYVRWTVVGRRESTLLEENIFEVSKEISGGAGIESVVRRVRGWIPDDDTFRADFKEAVIPKSSQARYLLTKIESRMREQQGLDELVVASSAKVHVEHIYPQSPEREWRLDDHDSWVNRLGNQTLLHGRKNRSLSNHPYPEKRDAYASSELLLTRDALIANIWNEAEGFWRVKGIEERQEKLADIALIIWTSGKEGSHLNLL